MKYNQEYMNSTFDTMLDSGEESICPVYCVFKQTGFWASNSRVSPGFVTFTSNGRLLVARSQLFDMVKRSVQLDNVKKMKIKKNLFGQYLVEAAFMDVNGDLRLKFQVAKKIMGAKFPNQEQNFEELISTLRQYETV